MVEAAHPAFIARGLTSEECFSDAFRLGQRAAPQAELMKLGGGA